MMTDEIREQIANPEDYHTGDFISSIQSLLDDRNRQKEIADTNYKFGQEQTERVQSLLDENERLREQREAWVSTAKGAASDVIAMAKTLREIAKRCEGESDSGYGYIHGLATSAIWIAGVTAMQPPAPIIVNQPLNDLLRKMLWDSGHRPDHMTACYKTMGDSHPCTCGANELRKLLVNPAEPKGGGR